LEQASIQIIGLAEVAMKIPDPSTRSSRIPKLLVSGILLWATLDQDLPCRSLATELIDCQDQTTSQAAAPQAADPLLDMLKSPNADARAKAARQLGKGGDRSVVPALSSALTDPSVKVRREVVVALATLGTPDALDALVSASKDPDPDIRVTAIDGLAGHYTGRTPATGFVGFMKRSYSRAKSHFEPDDVRIDPGVSVDPKVVSALVAAMNDSRSIQPAREAAKALGVLLARSALPDLIKAAHSNDEDLAREALNSLAKIRDTSAGPQLTDLLDSSNQDVRRDAAVTIGLLRTKAAVPRLQSMYQGSAKKDKEAALEALADIGDPASDPIFMEALHSADKKFRALGAEGLGQAHDVAAMPEVEKALETEKDADAKLAMHYALAAFGNNNALGALVDSLDSTLHADAAQTYLIQFCQNPQSLAKLYPYLDSKNAAIRKRLCTVLVYTGNQTSLEPLQHLSHDSNNDVALEALRALRAIRARGIST
jgi:HEAT repeat protein